MTAENVERGMYRGDTFTFTTRLLNDDGTVFPLAPSGTKVWMTAKYAFGSADDEAPVRVTNEINGGITVVNSTTGEVEIAIPSALTANMPDGTCRLHYDIRGRLPTGEVSTLETGTLSVKPSVTRVTL